MLPNRLLTLLGEFGGTPKLECIYLGLSLFWWIVIFVDVVGKNVLYLK